MKLIVGFLSLIKHLKTFTCAGFVCDLLYKYVLQVVIDSLVFDLPKKLS